MDHNNIDILYEDADILVINKPAGLVVHSDGKTKEDTVADWVARQYPEIEGVGEQIVLSDGTKIERSGIVHRLDRGTSGVLVVAKTQDAFTHMKKQFQERLVEKTYTAIVYGVVKKDADIINRPIGKSSKDFRRWSAQRGARGAQREAITEYKTTKQGDKFTVLEVKPKTGRTHQIRVHLKAINHPVVCDTLYAPKRECALGLKRQALHAKILSFTNIRDKRITIEAPLPNDLEQAVARV